MAIIKFNIILRIILLLESQILILTYGLNITKKKKKSKDEGILTARLGSCMLTTNSHEKSTLIEYENAKNEH